MGDYPAVNWPPCDTVNLVQFRLRRICLPLSSARKNYLGRCRNGGWIAQVGHDEAGFWETVLPGATPGILATTSSGQLLRRPGKEVVMAGDDGRFGKATQRPYSKCAISLGKALAESPEEVVSCSRYSPRACQMAASPRNKSRLPFPHLFRVSFHVDLARRELKLANQGALWALGGRCLARRRCFAISRTG